MFVDVLLIKQLINELTNSNVVIRINDESPEEIKESTAASTEEKEDGIDRI